MRTMRTIDAAAAEIRAADPHTALTKTALRRLVVTGAVPSVRVGTKYLLDLDALDAYLAGEQRVPEPVRGIRRIEVRG